MRLISSIRILEQRTGAVIVGLLKRCSAEKVRDIDVWGGLPLYHLRAPAAAQP